MKITPKNFKKLAVNSFFSGLSEFSTILLFLLFIIAARTLGDAKFGIFSFGLAYVGMFGIINDCGLRYLYITEVSKDNSLTYKYFGNILSLQIILSLTGLSLIFASIQFFDKTDETRMVVYLLSGAEAMRSLKFFFRFVFRTAERFELESITVSLERITLLVTGLTLLILGYGVIALAATFLCVRILDFFVTLFLIKKIMPLNLSFDFPFCQALLKRGLPFALTGVVILILLRIDTIMISIIKNDAEVGWYNAGYKLIEGAAFFPAILVNSLLPSVSRLSGNMGEISALYQRCIKYTLLISIPLSCIGFILSDKIIFFVFGKAYVHSIVVFEILILSLVFTFAYHVGGAVLAGIGKQKTSLCVACTILFINIGLNSILIPIKGYVGAAIATLVSEVLYCVLYGCLLFSFGYRVKWFALALKPLLASVTISILIAMFPASLGLTLLVALLGYFTIITSLSYWDSEELLFLKRMAQSFRGLFFTC